MAGLNDIMEFDRVVYSDGTGSVHSASLWSARPGNSAPEPYVDLDADGQMVSLDPADIHGLGGWTLLDGFSGQYRYAGPIMHDSEFIGGGLEAHIREHPGYYAAVVVTGAGPRGGDDDIVGWAVAYRES